MTEREFPVKSEFTESEEQPRVALTYRKAGQALGVCERVVWQLVKDGWLKAIRIGRSVRIPVTEVERFVADQIEG